MNAHVIKTNNIRNHLTPQNYPLSLIKEQEDENMQQTQTQLTAHINSSDDESDASDASNSSSSSYSDTDSQTGTFNSSTKTTFVTVFIDSEDEQTYEETSEQLDQAMSKTNQNDSAEQDGRERRLSQIDGGDLRR